jgi:hypothetical protein
VTARVAPYEDETGEGWGDEPFTSADGRVVYLRKEEVSHFVNFRCVKCHHLWCLHNSSGESDYCYVDSCGCGFEDEEGMADDEEDGA